MANTRLYLVRHGKTMFNTIGRAQGWSDTPLTEVGERGIHELGIGLREAGLDFKLARSSDSGRTIQTMGIILEELGLTGQIPYTFDKRIREWCFGSFDGGYDGELFMGVMPRAMLHHNCSCPSPTPSVLPLRRFNRKRNIRRATKSFRTFLPSTSTVGLMRWRGNDCSRRRNASSVGLRKPPTTGSALSSSRWRVLLVLAKTPMLLNFGRPPSTRSTSVNTATTRCRWKPSFSDRRDCSTSTPPHPSARTNTSIAYNRNIDFCKRSLNSHPSVTHIGAFYVCVRRTFPIVGSHN